jgi:hypothetical protein
MIDFLVFHFWRWFWDLAPTNVRVYIRGERELAAVPDFLARYRLTVWQHMTERERRFTKWLGWTTP